MKKKLFYLSIICLTFALTKSNLPKTRIIDPTRLSGNITLSLRHGIWRFWQEKPVYQTLMIDLVCHHSKCESEAFAYAPRFNQELEYISQVEKVWLDGGWHLKVKVKYQQLFSKTSVTEANYHVQLVPDPEGLIGSYTGKLADNSLRGKVQVTVKPMPQLTANYPSVNHQSISNYILQPDQIPISQYKIHRNINYLTVNNYSLKLDVYEAKNNRHNPTLIYIHGGGWHSGSKSSFQSFWPYLNMGFSIVNIEYRLRDIAPAPAAVEDCLCALYWVQKNAAKYHFDLEKIVIMGHSAGGHLALMTAMASDVPTLSKNCPFYSEQKPKIAAVINWFGPTDLVDLLKGNNQRDYALTWLEKSSDPLAVAGLVSPLNYVRKDNPPILSIHGNEDSLVPYNHATRLHQALNDLDVTNGLITLKGGDHGGFSRGEMKQIYVMIDSFLKTSIPNQN